MVDLSCVMAYKKLYSAKMINGIKLDLRFNRFVQAVDPKKSVDPKQKSSKQLPDA